ncbi:hypothetical protein [Sphingomonas sp. SRS2]|uniref:hypothetical protein n=1 Tax=Sphingomonas sp. SRS2 TaxID=133190 RepID=UPI00061849CE|nr:hypothetical protein [Sphingomonas sp. SRS2]KKC28005.1 hypothetical protein WP12_00205 [Sphingomonas sp. SRS2]
MFLQPDLFDSAKRPGPDVRGSMSLPGLIERIADVSPRPRYAFMVLNLIAKVANNNSGSAGPYVVEHDRRIPLRDWLCDSLVPMAKRDARRLAIVNEVRSSLNRMNVLPSDVDAAERMVEEEVRARVRRSGRCNVSRAVSDLVRAGLLRRHYQGFRVDHHNRGAQREAVYTITALAAGALNGRK